MNGQTSFAAYDGARAILEYNGSGAVTASTLYGLGVDEVTQRNNNGTQQFFFQDRLGNTRSLTNAVGEVIEQYRYDAFGAPSFYTGPTATSLAGAAISGNTTMQNNRILFTGREWVAGFGFYEYRARAYNPTLGRFMSEDPIGFAAGDANLFRYCGGDPVNYVDPTGLFQVTVFGGEGAGGYVTFGYNSGQFNFGGYAGAAAGLVVSIDTTNQGVQPAGTNAGFISTYGQGYGIVGARATAYGGMTGQTLSRPGQVLPSAPARLRVSARIILARRRSHRPAAQRQVLTPRLLAVAKH